VCVVCVVWAQHLVFLQERLVHSGLVPLSSSLYVYTFFLSHTHKRTYLHVCVCVCVSVYVCVQRLLRMRAHGVSRSSAGDGRES
jgi:hypothetical protein